MATMDLTGLGVIGPMRTALLAKQPRTHVPGRGQAVQEGPGRPGAPGSDRDRISHGRRSAGDRRPGGRGLVGPGAYKGFWGRVVLVTDTGWEGCLEGACIGAGISPVRSNGGIPKRCLTCAKSTSRAWSGDPRPAMRSATACCVIGTPICGGHRAPGHEQQRHLPWHERTLHQRAGGGLDYLFQKAARRASPPWRGRRRQ